MKCKNQGEVVNSFRTIDDKTFTNDFLTCQVQNVKNAFFGNPKSKFSIPEH